jgi:hypothetical protein
MFGKGIARRRKRTNHGWRRIEKRVGKDLTRTPSRTTAAGFYQGETPPTLDVDMTDWSVDQFEGSPEDLDPPGGVWPAAESATRKMARRMWATSYGEEYEKEFQLYSENGLLECATQMMLHLPASSWVLQGRSTEVNAARRRDKEHAMLMRWCSEAAHQRNHAFVPFAIASRSIQHLGLKASSRSWTDTACVLSRSTSTALVNAMVDVRPPCRFEQSLRVHVYFYDQVL